MDESYDCQRLCQTCNDCFTRDTNGNEQYQHHQHQQALLQAVEHDCYICVRVWRKIQYARSSSEEDDADTMSSVFPISYRVRTLTGNATFISFTESQDLINVLIDFRVISARGESFSSQGNYEMLSKIKKRLRLWICGQHSSPLQGPIQVCSRRRIGYNAAVDITTSADDAYRVLTCRHV
jgi:hypothetical protein